MLTSAQCPFTGPYGLPTSGLKSKGPTATALKRAMIRLALFDGAMSAIDDQYNAKLEDSLDVWDPGGKNGYGEGRWEKIRATKIPKGLPHAGEYALDATALKLIQDEAKKPPAVVMPALGPVYKGGASVLACALTHKTEGISLFPAFDTAFSAGVEIVAPERISVYQDSSSNPGDACYARGDSGLRYWIGHLAKAPSKGTVIAKGARIGVTYSYARSHCHWAVNVEKFSGFKKGQQLLYGATGVGPDYTYGSPLIGDQLRAGP